MPPEIMRTGLLDEWVIVTRKTQKAGFAIAHTKYPIPEIILEQIAYDVLIKQMEGCEKGYTFEISNKKKNEVYKVTVERVVK